MTVLPSPNAGIAPALRGVRLLGHHDLGGFGNIGEGMSVQVLRDGRRILWLAHEGPPVNFTGLDVSDPRAPRVICQERLPHTQMRSNSLDVVGDVLVVACQVTRAGDAPAGFDIFDVSTPESPRKIGFFDASGPHSRGVHQLWFVDGVHVHVSAGAADFQPHDVRDDQIYRIIDISRPAAPREAGRWWLPGTRLGDAEPPLRGTVDPMARYLRVHNTNIYPARPDRAYLGYLDAGVVVLDIADMSRPKPVARWDNSPPHAGFTHTALPLFERQLMIVTDESIVDGARDWPKMTWVLDMREESRPLPIATLPLPDPKPFAGLKARFGSHNIHENRPCPGSLVSEDFIFGTFFAGGMRVFDIRNPFVPVEIAHFQPEPPNDAPNHIPQINDVFVDDRGVIYAAERHMAGVYCLECRAIGL